jgi:hypothetical protein
MRALSLYLLSAFLLCGTLPASAATTSNPTSCDFQRQWGGYLTSSDFKVDPDRPGVILPPAGVRVGDLLWIRPLRLNADEYLILQKCVDANCGKAQVVRAWNAYGYMGPYPVLTNTVSVQPGVSYMLWLQRVPTKGTGSFHLYERDAPPLTFKPAGSPELFSVANLKAAREHGPAQIRTAETTRASFVVTFEGGSVVRMQARRAAPPQAMAANAGLYGLSTSAQL